MDDFAAFDLLNISSGLGTRFSLDSHSENIAKEDELGWPTKCLRPRPNPFSSQSQHFESCSQVHVKGLSSAEPTIMPLNPANTNERSLGSNVRDKLPDDIDVFDESSTCSVTDADGKFDKFEGNYRVPKAKQKTTIIYCFVAFFIILSDY